MATLLSVIALMLTGQSLTPVNVFMLISFINVLRVSCSVLLAYGFLDTYDAYASLGRIEKFLLLENVLRFLVIRSKMPQVTPKETQQN